MAGWRHVSCRRMLCTALFFSLLTLCACFSPRSTVTIQVSPSIPLVNEMIVFEAFAEGDSAIYEWNWTFGDGGTASGKRVWHVYRTIDEEGGIMAPWKVSVTAVDASGRVSSSAEYVQVQPYSGYLANYSILAVGSACTGLGTREPEIAPGMRLFSSGSTELEPYWNAPFDADTFFLIELHMVEIQIREVSCDWSLLYLGEDETEWPSEVHSAERETWPNYDKFLRPCPPGDPRTVCYDPEPRWYTGHLGYVFGLNPEAMDLTSGWYLLFANLTATQPLTLDHNVYSYRIHIGY